MRRLAPGFVLAVIALAVAAPAAAAATATPQPVLLFEPALDPANAAVVYQPGAAYGAGWWGTSRSAGSG